MNSGTEYEFPEENFFEKFGIHHNSNGRQVLISLYFSFTSLSTIGFGDYHPRSNFERIFCAIILVSGVMIFSYIMGMIKGYQELNGDLDDSDQLAKFFGLMKRYNKNKDIN
jgi:hypothetical protein